MNSNSEYKFIMGIFISALGLFSLLFYIFKYQYTQNYYPILISASFTSVGFVLFFQGFTSMEKYEN
jgi:hypothetical protein